MARSSRPTCSKIPAAHLAAMARILQRSVRCAGTDSSPPIGQPRRGRRPWFFRFKATYAAPAGFIGAKIQRAAGFALTCPTTSRVGGRRPGRRNFSDESGCFGSDLVGDTVKPSRPRSRTTTWLLSFSLSSPSWSPAPAIPSGHRCSQGSARIGIPSRSRGLAPADDSDLVQLTRKNSISGADVDFPRLSRLE
jgi:hypothetical protein